MRWKINILYISLLMLYAVFFFFCYPLWSLSSALPIFILIGLGAWLYGIQKALIIFCVCMNYHAYVLSVHYGDLFDTYQAKFSSTLVIIGLSYLVGNLRKNHDAIKRLHRELDEKVAERTHQLSYMTAELLSMSENQKISSGERLHDGIGQQLTGMRLLSSSLVEQLKNETNPAQTLSDDLRMKLSKIHMQIRRIARLLFPIRIGQVGITAALQELSAIIYELKNVRLDIRKSHGFTTPSENISLQVYRICQEISLNAIDFLRADRISIQLKSGPEKNLIYIIHNGIEETEEDQNGSQQLIHYRLNQISGSMNISRKLSGWTIKKIEYFHSQPPAAETE